jgi:hypothetical protein
VQVGVYGGWIYGGWIWSWELQSQHTNVDALQVLSRSQITLELSMSMRIRPICKVYIHTYIQNTSNSPRFCSIWYAGSCLTVRQLYTISRVIAPDKSVGRWMAAQSHCCACMYLKVRTGLHQCDAVQTHCYHVPFQSRCSTAPGANRNRTWKVKPVVPTRDLEQARRGAQREAPHRVRQLTS